MFSIITHKSSLLRKASAILAYFYVKLRFGSKFVSGGFVYFGKFTKLIVGNNSTIKIGAHCQLLNYAELQSQGELCVGDSLSVNSYSRVVSYEKISIGNNVTLAQFVSILDHDHGYVVENGNLKLEGYLTDPIEIGDNVWIGDKCTILKGSKIGSNVIVAANTLVNGDVPSNSICGGVPFKILKSIYSEES